MLMHIRTHIPVIPMSKNRDVIKENIRSLEAELVEPAIFGNDIFELIVGQIIESFHAQNIVSGKTWHGSASFLFEFCI